MDSSRRRILQLLGLSSLALTARPVFNAFAKEFSTAFQDPRRFTYTPLIRCCGRKA